ncbi:hypothetical protein [Longimicrobium sp.]|uniref:hypothetical protein n=1 Tax=Longimicrobium sp. TaxID=2029185 RepID=UPI002B520E2F|nr:hypothetical protein [Longimicrobium sp.]HSU16489.1 hypothetical protein [Longimicrobium sp.]
MRKLKLDLDALDVTSFDVRAAGGKAGTVEGYATTYTKYPCRSIDSGCISDPGTCPNTYYCYTSIC